MIGYCLIGILILVVIFAIVSYNSLVKLRNLVEEAFSTMDVYMKKRFDLIPNLVETVKGYAAHEKSTLEEVVNLRGKSYGTMSPEEKIEASTQMQKAIPALMALAESYPELKANENFNHLMSQLESSENDIANARKYYNGAVFKYNTKIQTIPFNLIAGMGGFEKKPLFEVSDSQERENVKVSF